MFTYTHPEPNRSIQSLSKIYPRPSPYIQSNLHKFGTGPSSTIIPVQNQIPVYHRKLNLNAKEYYKKADIKQTLCYCCFEPVSQDYMDNVEKYFNFQFEDDEKSGITEEGDDRPSFQAQIVFHASEPEQTKTSYSQTSLMKYFKKQKKQEKALEIQIQKTAPTPTCVQCSKIICKSCARVCHRCHKLVCKFDFRQDNSLGLHNCN